MTSLSTETISAEVLNLEIAREADRIKIGLTTQRSGETQTVRHIEELSVSMDQIDNRCRTIVATINQANRRGCLTKELLGKLKEAGQLFRDDLFPAHVKAQFNAGTADQLIVTLDDRLVHIPWELLHDGEQFLGQRFAMGRVVRTRQPIVSHVSRSSRPPLQMLVLADPCGDLKSAYAEGIALRDVMEAFQDQLWVSFRSEGVSPDFLKAKIRNYDWVHFAGHADYDGLNPERSGWRLDRGQLAAADVIKMAGTGAMPALIFSNACQSARTDAWDVRPDAQDRIFGLANAFILSGVKHYVGTFWEIPDETSQRFALAFYHFLLNGFSVGAAMRAARLKLIREYGEENIVWAGYLLYGDPTVSYLEPVVGEMAAAPSNAPIADIPPRHIAAELRAPEETIRFTSLGTGKKNRPGKRLAMIGASTMLLAALILGAFFLGAQKSTGQYEERAISAFHTGNYSEVEQTCRRLQEKAPQRSLSYLLLGNVSFLKGELERARDLYQNAVTAQHGNQLDKAEACIGLGRIASENGQTAKALQFYRQASELAPNKEQPYLAQAVLLEQQGDLTQAAELLNQIKPKASDLATISSLAARLDAKADMAKSRQRQERIDHLIEELQTQMGSQTANARERDWSSRPLTVWLMDLDTVGYSLQEGAAGLLTSNISDRLLEQKRMQIVERDLLDKLMTELKLGTSQLTNLSTALSLGRLAAARLMVAGRMVHRAPNTEVTLRCFETETSQVTLVVNALFETSTPISVMADRITDELILKLRKQYPLRAKIIEKRGNNLILDVGSRHGTAVGVTLKAVDSDLTAQIMNVDVDKCSARIMAGEAPAAEGMRLEEVK